MPRMYALCKIPTGLKTAANTEMNDITGGEPTDDNFTLAYGSNSSGPITDWLCNINLSPAEQTLWNVWIADNAASGADVKYYPISSPPNAPSEAWNWWLLVPVV